MKSHLRVALVLCLLATLTFSFLQSQDENHLATEIISSNSQLDFTNSAKTIPSPSPNKIANAGSSINVSSKAAISPPLGYTPGATTAATIPTTSFKANPSTMPHTAGLVKRNNPFSYVASIPAVTVAPTTLQQTSKEIPVKSVTQAAKVPGAAYKPSTSIPKNTINTEKRTNKIVSAAFPASIPATTVSPSTLIQKVKSKVVNQTITAQSVKNTPKSTNTTTQASVSAIGKNKRTVGVVPGSVPSVLVKIKNKPNEKKHIIVP